VNFHAVLLCGGFEIARCQYKPRDMSAQAPPAEVLRASDLSGFVARDLSGFTLSPQRGATRETDGIATGDSEDEVQRGL
jgi:hypothetical protein